MSKELEWYIKWICFLPLTLSEKQSKILKYLSVIFSILWFWLPPILVGLIILLWVDVLRIIVNDIEEISKNYE